jgi:hypothetical protein
MSIPDPSPSLYDSLSSSMFSLLSRISSLEQSIYVDAKSVPIEPPQLPALPAALTVPPEPVRRISIIGASASLLSPKSPSPSLEPQFLPNLLSKLDELSMVWGRLEDETMRNFFVKYTIYEPELMRKLDLNTHELSTVMKQAILLSSYNELVSTGEQLKQLQQLQTEMEKQPFNNIHTFAQTVQSQNQIFRVQHSQALILHSQIEQFLTLYNQLMDYISRKFVNMDATIKKWETIVDKIAQTKSKK